MSPENTTPKPENQVTITKTTHAKLPQEESPKCPRCESSNTKFCYYNNYSLTQPRHFCKTCKRYWTRGGALRNVPIGGATRKSNKKLKPNLTTSPRLEPGFTFLNSDTTQGGTTAGVYTQFITSGPGGGPYFGEINREMHWKLQQQRLLGSFIYGPSSNIIKENNNNQEINSNLQVSLDEVIKYM